MQVCEDLAIKILKIVHIESNIFHVTSVEWNSWGSYAVNWLSEAQPLKWFYFSQNFVGLFHYESVWVLNSRDKISLAKVPREIFFFLSLSKVLPLEQYQDPDYINPFNLG